MTLVFDTSALSMLLEGDERMIRVVTAKPYDRLLIPLAVEAELRFGYAYGAREFANLEHYQHYIATYGAEIWQPSQDDSITYASLAAWARKHGVSVSNNDLWIAGAAIISGGELLTTDKDFSRFPQIRLVQL